MLKMSSVENAVARRARIDFAKDAMMIIKNAQVPDYEKRRARLKMILLALSGAYMGSLTGANVAGLNGGKIGKGALIGAGIGTALGAGLGAASNSANRWAGIDPLVRTVAIAKS